jgi:pimeloyl-ACP methyl ester carboxylesterase
LPYEDPAYDRDFEKKVETFETQDGAVLKLKRYVRPAARPIILVHGYLGNGYEFDLPHKGHNLALYLAERGYDVWIPNLRGCGREPYRSQVRDWRFSMDELAAFDLSAITDGVRAATGKLPVWIGHSMGGSLLYMYLQGVRVEKVPSGSRVTVDPELSARRNRSILGAVSIAGPPGFHGRGRGWLTKLSRSPNFPVYARWLMNRLRSRARVAPRFPDRLGPFVSRHPHAGLFLAMHGPISNYLYNAKNVDPDVGYSLLKWASDNVSNRVSAQLAGMLLGDLMSYDGEYNYTRNMEKIAAPLLFITGTNDFVGPDNIKELGFDRVSSQIKRFELFDHYGHTDLLMGKQVEREVFPVIAGWLEELEMAASQELAGRKTFTRGVILS